MKHWGPGHGFINPQERGSWLHVPRHMGVHIPSSNALCFRSKGEASKQQEGLALYQGAPQPPLLSRRQSLETQFLTHRLQVQSHTNYTHSLTMNLFSDASLCLIPDMSYQAEWLICITFSDTVWKCNDYQLCHVTMVIILSAVISPNLSSAQKASVLANSPASCQLFCKETPRSLEQQLQEHR